jgi:hypothetical protein
MTEQLTTDMETCTLLDRPVLSLIETDTTVGIVTFLAKSYKMDLQDAVTIMNSPKRFHFYSDTDVYPAFKNNGRLVTLIEYIYSLNPAKCTFFFKNSDVYDLRKVNVDVSATLGTSLKKYDANPELQKLLAPYNIQGVYSKGHTLAMGREANTLKNPIWMCKTDDDRDELLMYCVRNKLCILCHDSYKKVLEYERDYNHGHKITFAVNTGGYVSGSVNLYIHQIIMGCFGHGRGTMNISVDHIDGNPLNNTLQNLRIATREEQEEHKIGIKEGTKRKRQCTAKDLPEGIDQSMLRKYIVYYNEVYHKEKQLKREFFKVESHPKLDKPWISSKSGKVSALEKLTAANKVVDDLANDIFPTLQESVLPQYYSLITFRDKPHLVYEQRMQDTGERRNLKMVLPPEGTYDLTEQYQKLLAKVETKYALAAPI